MQSAIHILLKVQEMDGEAVRLRLELGRYPALREERQAALRRAETQLARAREERRELERRVRDLEKQVAGWREDLSRFSAQQFQVKNQKEYEALTHQMEELREKISQADGQGLESLTHEERLDGTIADLEQAEAQARLECAEELKRLEAREAEKRSLLARVEAARAEHAAGLEPAVLRRYERLHAQYPARALAPLVDGTCGGCHISLLPRVLQDLRRPDSLTECTSCHRFLYLP